MAVLQAVTGENPLADHVCSAAFDSLSLYLLPSQVCLDTLRLIPGNLTNENRLLLACSHKILTDQQLEEARAALSGGVDWTLLRRKAQDHGLSPLLYWHL